MSKLVTVIVLERNSGGMYYLNIEDQNGQVLFTSEAYDSKRNAKRAGRKLFDRFLTLHPVKFIESLGDTINATD